MAEKQFIVFRLEKEQYGIDIKNISSISEYLEITKVPNSPSLIEGVINLRGDIVPVVSLKRKFNVPDCITTAETRIILYKSSKNVVGFLVDEVSQVIKLDQEAIDPPPDIIRSADREYIEGIGKVEGKIIILLNLERMTDDFSANMESLNIAN